jgi:hypothetical protein
MIFKLSRRIRDGLGATKFKMQGWLWKVKCMRGCGEQRGGLAQTFINTQFINSLARFPATSAQPLWQCALLQRKGHLKNACKSGGARQICACYNPEWFKNEQGSSLPSFGMHVGIRILTGSWKRRAPASPFPPLAFRDPVCTAQVRTSS